MTPPKSQRSCTGIKEISVNNEWLLKVTTSIGDMAAGTFYYDVANAVLYIWCSDNGNPTNKSVFIMEVDSANYDTKQNGFMFYQSGFSYINVQNLTIKYAQNIGLWMVANYCNIDNLIVKFCSKAGIRISTLGSGNWQYNNVSNCTIQNCVMHNWPRGKFNNGYAGWDAAVGISTQYSNVYGCTITNNNGEGLSTGANITDKHLYISFHNNTVGDNWSENIYHNHGSYYNVYKNFVYSHEPDYSQRWEYCQDNHENDKRFRPMGIGTSDEEPPASTDHIYIFNNVIMGCRYGWHHYGHASGSTLISYHVENNTIILPNAYSVTSGPMQGDSCYGLVRSGWYAGTTDVIIKNNIIYGQHSSNMIATWQTDPAGVEDKFLGILIDHNLCYLPNAASPWFWGKSGDPNYTYGQWLYLAGLPHGSGDVLNDPLFINATSFVDTDKAIQSGSPAINAGYDLTVEFNYDYLGNIRPLVNTFDIGAFEGSYAISVSQNGITWNFDSSYRVGNFLLGDYWVLPNGGSINPTVVSVSPAPTGSGSSKRNGSMVNVGGGTDHFIYQGFDGRGTFYSETLAENVTYPIALSPGKSLVATESSTDGVHNDVTGAPAATPDRADLKQAAILTCLATAPPADAFRPAYVGNTKTIYTESQINWSILPNYAPTTGIRSQATYESWVTKCWIDCQREFPAQCLHPYLHMPAYGRELSGAIGEAALFTCCNYTQAQKRKIVLGIIQIGIDNYFSMLINNTMRPVNGVHNVGRKLPIVYAGKLLGQSEFLSASYQNQEDDSSYFGNSKSPVHNLWTGWQNGTNPYRANVLRCFGIDLPSGCYEHIDPSLWGQSPFPYWSHYPFDSASHEGYLTSAQTTLVSHALAMRMMGATADWNHDAFFALADRWMYENYATNRAIIIGYWWATTQSHPPPAGSVRYAGDTWPDCDVLTSYLTPTWDTFTASMWTAYRGSINPPITTTAIRHSCEVIVEVSGGYR